MKNVEIRSRYGARKRVAKKFELPTRTDISQKDACDINKVLYRYLRTGTLSHVNPAVPVFGDVSKFGDYQDCLAKVSAADKVFAGLPALVRQRFKESPAEFLKFCGDKANYDEAVKLGLMPKRKDVDVPKDVPKDSKDEKAEK